MLRNLRDQFFLTFFCVSRIMDSMNEENTAVKPKVLLVEDNETFRKVIKNAMMIEGFEVYEAENGQLGLDAALKHHPDLMVIDLYMPVMDGMKMLGAIKANDILRAIPVLMVTNVQEELENAVKHGAEEALLKTSLTPRQLIEVCRKHLSDKSK